MREYNDAIDARVEKAFEDLKKQKQQPKRKTQENQRASNGNGKNSRGKMKNKSCSLLYNIKKEWNSFIASSCRTVCID